MKLKNKEIGAKVIVSKVTVEINPTVKWKQLKNVPGVIVKNKGYEFYYHNSDGAYKSVHKNIITIPSYNTFAVKLDDGIKDIEGNNIVVFYEHDLKFIEYLNPVNIVSKKQYNEAMKIIKEYNYQQTLK